MSEDSRTPAPTPHADREAEDVEEQAQIDERRIREEVAKHKDLIDAISGDTSEDALRRALHEKKLGRLELKYEIIIEKKRLARELLKLEEMHGALYSEPCLICLEDIHVDADASMTRRFVCCGGFICVICLRTMQTIDKCPLCRKPITNSASKNVAQSMALAKRGVAWAQTNVGICMRDGIQGFQKQRRTGIEWLKTTPLPFSSSQAYTVLG